MALEKTVTETTSSIPSRPIGPGVSNITLRSILIGIVFIPFVCLWIVHIEYVRYSDSPTLPALFFHCISILVGMYLLNSLLKRWLPQFAFSRSEMLTVYIMLAVASNLCGHDFMQVLFSSLTFVFHFARPENRWEEYAWPDIPGWVANRNGDALDDLFRGDTSLYEQNHLLTWLMPVLVWSVFIIVLAMTMYCIMSIFRKQWENERLNYPVAEVPLILTGGDDIWKRWPFWIGCLIAASTQIINFAHLIRSEIPALPIQVIYLRSEEPPWNAAGAFPISYFPFALGMAWLMPLELSFSCWVFLFLTRGMLVASAMSGRTRGGFPFLREQSAAGHIALCITTIWSARSYLRNVLRRMFSRYSDEVQPRIERHNGRHDDQEPLRYSMAGFGVMAGFVLLVGFALAIGMSIWTSLTFFTLFFMIVFTVARLRAEVGLPLVELFRTGAEDITVNLVGSKRFTRNDLVGLSLLSWMTRTNRQFPMQVHTDALRIGNRAGMSLRGLSIVILIATVFGAFVSWWALLHIMYPLGLASAKNAGPALWAFGPEPWNRLTQWINNPVRLDWDRMGCYLFGFLLTMALATLRLRFLWWPLHPAGFIVACNASLPRIWIPVFVSWMVKSAVIRYGGLKAHRAITPFFIGLIIGEFVTGFLRTLIALAFNIWLPRESGIGGL